MTEAGVKVTPLEKLARDGLEGFYSSEQGKQHKLLMASLPEEVQKQVQESMERLAEVAQVVFNMMEQMGVEDESQALNPEDVTNCDQYVLSFLTKIVGTDMELMDEEKSYDESRKLAFLIGLMSGCALAAHDSEQYTLRQQEGGAEA